MTDTERIANQVYDKHVGLSVEAENLGIIAAQCDLLAADPLALSYQKAYFSYRAASYREAQAVEMRRTRC